jgi:hypothetical protein
MSSSDLPSLSSTDLVIGLNLNKVQNYFTLTHTLISHESSTGADILAGLGFHVVMPDLFRKEPFDLAKFPPKVNPIPL